MIYKSHYSKINGFAQI